VEAHSAQHIADLEARLAKADENVLVLRDTMESLELQSDSRRRQAEELDHQLRNLTKDGEGWRASLEEREQRVSELEEKLRQWEEAKDQAADDRARLGGLVGTVSKARQSLDMEVSRAQNSDAAEKAAIPEDAALQAQYVALQETHTATLADLSAVSAKYRDALREISDLAAQIAEAKLQNVQIDAPEDVTAAPQYESMSLGRRGIGKRVGLEAFEHSGVSIGGSNSGSGNGTGGRRLFFRQAASAESLHARSQSQQSQSQLLSQELSSARTPKHSLTSANGVSPGSPASSVDGRSHTPKLSLLAPVSVQQPSSPEDRGRSVQSLEKEIMRLQEVLKEREAEIGVLEGSLKEMNQSQHKQRATSLTLNGTSKNTDDDDDVPHAKNSGGRLSPTTMKRFARIRSSLIIENPPRFPDEPTPEAVDRLDELMRCVLIYATLN
jgi:kinesin family protein 4/21/27